MSTTGQRHTDDKQRVLDATDIVQLVGEHVTLRAKGREYAGLCPFHDDHKPSMNVVPHKQIYHCFSCGAGGDALAFVMNYHKMGFREALEYLAEKANITLTPWRPRSTAPGDTGQDAGWADDADRTVSERRSILSANLTALNFFRVILNHPEHGAAARAMIDRRGISPAMAEAFALGAAPDRWDGLTATIAGKEIDPAPFLAAGLFKRRADAGSGPAGHYDAFRNRLIFPIHDLIGRVVAFGGRRLADEKRADGSEDAKYLNSPESAAFDKSTTLYGLFQAAQGIKRTRTAIVTEGYTDTIACHQAGVINAVATLGTALTAGNARILRRLCDTVVLLFDGDAAGQRAAERAVEVFFAEPVDLKIAALSAVTDAKDPDELLKRDGGVGLFNDAIARATDPLTLMFDKLRAELAGKGESARTRVAEEFIARVVDLGLRRVSPVRQQLIVKRMSQMTGVDAERIYGVVNGRTARTLPPAPTAPRWGSDGRVDHRPLTLREHLLACILLDGPLIFALGEPQSDLLDATTFDTPALQRVASAVWELATDGHNPDLPAVLSLLETGPAQAAATGLAAEVERLTERRPDRVRDHWRQCLAEAERERATLASAADATPGGVAAPPGRDAWNDALRQLEGQRARAAAVGVNPRSIPRPLTG